MDRALITKEFMDKSGFISNPKLDTRLSMERTLLSKQRTVLAEINIFAAFIGLTIIIIRLFVESIILKTLGAVALFAFIFPIISAVKKYFILQRKIISLDRINGFH